MKKVTFSNKITIRSMSVDKLTHSEEVKNPFSKSFSFAKSNKKDNLDTIFTIFILFSLTFILVFLWLKQK